MARTRTEKSGEKQGRDSRGRFAKGLSGNPCGLRRGSRHKATLAAQALLDGEAEALTRKAIEAAKGGDMIALRLCLERIIPVAKDKPISLTIPSVTSAEDLTKVLSIILDAVSGGKLTPLEAQTITGVVDGFRKMFEAVELEKRVARLEGKR